MARKMPHVAANQNLEFIPHTKRMNFKLLWEHRTKQHRVLQEGHEKGLWGGGNESITSVQSLHKDVCEH